MPTTTAGALKVLIESAGLGISAYADRAPAQAKRPYAVIQGGIATVPGPAEDMSIGVGVETAQVDLYQDQRNLTTGKLLEDYTLAPRLLRTLHLQQLSISGLITYAVVVVGDSHLVDDKENEVRDTYTCEVHREL